MDKIGKILLCLLLLSLLILLILWFALKLSSMQKTYIEAVGSSEIILSPQNASISFRIQSHGDSMETAEKSYIETVQSLEKNLIDAGLVHPQVVPGKYQVFTQRMEGSVTKILPTRDFTLIVPIDGFPPLQKVIDIISSIAPIENVNFPVPRDLISQAENRAMTDATTDARNKAEILAATHQKTLGDLVSVEPLQQDIKEISFINHQSLETQDLHIQNNTNLKNATKLKITCHVRVRFTMK